MPLKVCVMTSAHPAFDVRIFHKECRSLARQGFDVVLIAPGATGNVREGIRLKLLPRWRNRLERMVRGSAILFQEARRQNADIYAFHDPELIPIALLLRALGKRVVYDIHEDVPLTFPYKHYIPRLLRRPAGKMVGVFERWAAARFSALIAANPAIAARFSGVNPEVSVVHNYPKTEEFRTVSNEPPKGREGFLVYVGLRITLARGVKEMIQAIGLLPSSMQARLKLVGKPDPPRVVDSLARLPGWDRTDWLGSLDRAGVAAILHRARAGLVILHAEPNYLTAEPVKLFEYMCAGVPVIASDFPVCRAIVEKAGCGLLVNPLDPEDIARAIAYLWSHPEEAAAMGRRGFEAVQRQYNWANEEKTLLQVYRRLSLPRPAAGAQQIRPEQCP
jgi:glycosyltransferase involved in cell wall biosynthesis